MTTDFQFNPKVDLLLERVVDVSPELVWMAWTVPEHLTKWFTPKPWETIQCEIDLRPGGIFRTVMRSPGGQEFPNIGCYFEVLKNRRLVWTDVLGPGFRPTVVRRDVPSFTAVLTLEPHGKGGIKYSALAMHRDEMGRKQHEEMGFHEGWGTVLDQLVAYVKTV